MSADRGRPRRERSERIPVLRVPGCRPAPDREGDGRAALGLDAWANHPDELRQRVLLGRLQGRRGRVDGEVLRRLPLPCQLGHACHEAAPAGAPSRRKGRPAVLPQASMRGCGRAARPSSSRSCPRPRGTTGSRGMVTSRLSFR